jgi:hypothetical protein
MEKKDGVVKERMEKKNTLNKQEYIGCITLLIITCLFGALFLNITFIGLITWKGWK